MRRPCRSLIVCTAFSCSTTATDGFVPGFKTISRTRIRRRTSSMPFRRRDMPERRRSPRYIGLEKPSDDDFPDAVASSDEQSFTQLRGDDETYLEIESTADYHNESSTIEAPSVSEILRFAISAVAVFLCGPILSLIDTSAVGLLSGSSQLAALNPAVSVTEYSALLIAFLYTGTTNLIAASQEKDKSGSTKSRTADIFISALQLSGFVGAALGAILLTLSVPILKAIIGNNSIDPNIFSASLKYVRIRALGMPAAAFIGTAQAACLGMRDSKSPLYVLFAAAVVNFLGDICLVGNSNAWIGGAAGAAWATVVSQYAAVFFFVRLLCHDRPAESKADVTNIETTVNRFFPKKSSNDTIEEQNSPSKTEASRTKGFLKGKFRASVVFHLPSRDSISGFIPYIVPVTCTQVGRVSSYVSMSHVISSTLGTTSMAAQQVIISSWNCLYPVGESLSLTAQSFLPSIVERPMTGKNRASLLKKTLMNFWKSGLIFGSGLFATALCLPRLNPLLTSDPTVMASVNSVVPLLLVIYSTIGIFTSSEGMLLGQKDLGFLGKSYTSFFFIVPYFMLRLKRAALNAGSKTVNLKSVWTVFTCYQVFRTIMWALRALYLVQREGETGQR